MADVQLIGVEIGSMPLSGERWRVVVANVSRLAVLQELITLGWATTATEERAQAWFESVASLGLGYPASQPVARGELFVVDMKFSATHTALLPLSSILHRWEQQTPGTKVVRVERVPTSESSSAGATGRSQALTAAGEALRESSPVERLKEAGERAVSVLQLGFWAVIIGAGAYLVARARK